MHIQEAWDKALKRTEIIRPRIQPLSTRTVTRLPYIFLAESAVNVGDTVVRRGEMLVEEPALVLPDNLPQFEGLESPDRNPLDTDALTNFLYVRGIRFPSLKYSNKTFSVEVREGRLTDAVRTYKRELEQAENVSTGLIIGPEDCWQFSVLIFVATQVIRQAEGDIHHLLDFYRKKGPSCR